MVMPISQHIVNMDFGLDFSVFLSASGLVFTLGSNSFGQLGLGDFDPRNKPHLVRALKQANEKIIEISCGFKHVIVRSTLSKVFVWGRNRDYQLGTGDKKDRVLPEKVMIPS